MISECIDKAGGAFGFVKKGLKHAPCKRINATSISHVVVFLNMPPARF